MVSNEDVIRQKVVAGLQDTPFRVEPASVRQLSGGTGNFLYKATLLRPLDDGTTEVAVKHGEGFLASNEDFKLSTSRCLVEEQCLRSVAAMTNPSTPLFAVNTPAVFYFNQETSTQIQEFQPNAKSLKDYVLKNARDGAREQPHYVELGRSLGLWLRRFHDWANEPERPELREAARGNGELQKIKQWINYQNLENMRAKFPEALDGREAAFDAVAKLTAEELEDEARLRVIHGDFWTGNILLRDEPLQANPESPVFVVDWEMCQLGLPPLDVGQMVAELYQLYIFKGCSAGLWAIDGLMDGYGPVDDEFLLRAAMHVGAHLVCFGTSVQGWGDEAMVEEVARLGGEIVEKAWKKEAAWFKQHPVFRLMFRDW